MIQKFYLPSKPPHRWLLQAMGDGHISADSWNATYTDWQAVHQLRALKLAQVTWPIDSQPGGQKTTPPDWMMPSMSTRAMCLLAHGSNIFRQSFMVVTNLFMKLNHFVARARTHAHTHTRTHARTHALIYLRDWKCLMTHDAIHEYQAVIVMLF